MINGIESTCRLLLAIKPIEFSRVYRTNSMTKLDVMTMCCIYEVDQRKVRPKLYDWQYYKTFIRFVLDHRTY